MQNLISVIVFSWMIFGTFSEKISLSMPGVRPTMEDQYICHSMKIPDETLYITKFTPNASKMHAHHMLIYGCENAGSEKKTWNCGDQMNSNAENALSSAPICSSGPGHFLFSWAMNAPGFTLPKGVSFMIGKGTPLKYLVIQGHYKNVDYFKKPDSLPDYSGHILDVSKRPTPKLAGIYILVTGGYIPAKSTVYMDAACEYTGKAVIHPFSFRVHTHKLGKLVSGYIIHKGKWVEIGQKSPQDEQMFYPVNKSLDVVSGDMLAGRCIMKNDGDKLVRIGNTQKDEMCNFYFMYWVPRKDVKQLTDPNNQDCSSNGFPLFRWSSIFSESSIPKSASTLLDTNKIIEEEINGLNDEVNQFSDEFDQLWKSETEDEDPFEYF